MKELQQIINNKIEDMIANGDIKVVIENNIQKAVNEAISNQFRSYGSLTKQLEKELEEGLQISLKDISFETYNQQMLVAVKQKMGAVFASEASSKFMTEMDELLKPAPKEISINELVEVIAESWKTDEPWNSDDLDDRASVELVDHDWSHNSYTLKMWKKKEPSSLYSSRSKISDLDLFISDGKIRISHRHSYNPTCFSEHEAFVFKLYAAGTKLTGLENFDPDECDLTLKEGEDY
ncbi:hypothetical protein GZ77_20640 [Endozoicomonas montiporae]|uniref:Uncharacterized protein n=2 Tax=Endozoicomonas montiporae TaxID=1027273 RepID=A0A081N329_9GAMM|nr:hypothetical protein [Endozoicomonas montiporae]AMO58145.1 gp47 [Endozoicomonas montiporae CL-33]KEQ12852.1 hypothetical protein GZ77_20640 [Endozoicomonas montiporae]